MTAQPLSEQELAEGRRHRGNPRQAIRWAWKHMDSILASARERLTLAARAERAEADLAAAREEIGTWYDKLQAADEELAAARAEGERLRAMLDVATKRLTAIYMLLAPTDTIVDGKRYRFTPPDPAQYWRGLSDAIREIEEQFRPQPPALAAIASSRKGSEG